MAQSKEGVVTQAFKPRARLLQILGDQLIGSARLAVFELVKNAYDADATEVTVILEGLASPDPAIIVEDDGYGMSLETLRDVWLVPADDHRERERAARIRSPRYGRLPLGEKGVGRFAVHKLGERIELVTRADGEPECVLTIDWRDLIAKRFLDEAKVTIEQRPAEVFKGKRTGTRVRVTALRDPHWSKREVRELWRQVTSIASPFVEKDDRFQVKVLVPDREDWLQNLPDARALLDRAPYRFRFRFDGEELEFKYDFTGVPGMPLPPRHREARERLQIVSEVEPDDLDLLNLPPRRSNEKVVADQSTLEGIGQIAGQFFVYDRDKDVFSKYPDYTTIGRFLDQSGGVRIYRDDIRVYNYGEPDDDWLGLDLRRVNAPTKNISRNIIIGAIELSLEASIGLQEKTNREGFVSSPAFRHLRQIVRGALATLEVERDKDKRELRKLTGKPSKTPQGIVKPIQNLRKAARKFGVADELESSIRKIETDYDNLRDSFLRSGMSNVGLAVVFHEVERGVSALHKAIESGGSREQLQRQSGQLQAVLENSTRLLRKGEPAKLSLRNLVRSARDLLLVRFRMHEIVLTCPPLDEDGPDAEAVFSFNLALGALTNLIDNAIYWLRVAFPEDSSAGGRRRIYLNVVPDWNGGPAIVVADNGPGFVDEPERVVEPFFSRRPDGMGLGLYYANIVMQLNDGRLEFPDPNTADVPADFTGAIIALVFKKG